MFIYLQQHLSIITNIKTYHFSHKPQKNNENHKHLARYQPNVQLRSKHHTIPTQVFDGGPLVCEDVLDFRQRKGV